MKQPGSDLIYPHETLIDQEKQQFSERAKSELQRIDALIHQLLDMSRKVEGEKSVQVRSIDNGPGVKDAHIENIFDPFFTTKETGKGTGLGLCVSYTIMENLWGSILYI